MDAEPDALVWHATTEAAFESPESIGITTDSLAALVLEAEVAGCRYFRVAWRDASGEWPSNCVQPVSASPESGIHRYVVDLSTTIGWVGLKKPLDRVRVLLPAGATMRLHRFALSENVDPFAGASVGALDFPFERGHVHSLFVRPPASLTYKLTVMPDARFQSGVLFRGGGPATFRVVLKHTAGEEVVASAQVSQPDQRLELSANLTRWAGQPVELRLETDGAQPEDVALWMAPTLARAWSVTDAKRPINVLWYVIDCLRARNLGAYGYARDTSPRIDTVAKQGTLFRWCFSPGTWTIDSVASYFTGLTPNAHGMYRVRWRLPNEMVRLPELLRNAGYATALFSQNPYLTERRGFTRGFDFEAQYRVRDLAARRSRINDEYPMTQALRDYFDSYRETPFFAYVQSLEAHGPRIVPAKEKFFASGSGNALELDTYDNSVHWADTNLGKVVDTLQELGLLDSTLLIITADHGESIPELDGIYGHGDEPTLQRTHIPLILRLPGSVPAGAQIEGPVSALDIPRTILDLLGIECPTQFSGESLLPLLATPDAPSSRTVFADGDDKKWQAVARGPWYFHDKSGTHLLHHLLMDPDGRKDVSAENPAVVKDLLDATRAYRSAELEKATAFPPELAPAEVTDAATEELRALGYVK